MFSLPCQIMRLHRNLDFLFAAYQDKHKVFKLFVLPQNGGTLQLNVSKTLQTVKWSFVNIFQMKWFSEWFSLMKKKSSCTHNFSWFVFIFSTFIGKKKTWRTGFLCYLKLPKKQLLGWGYNCRKYYPSTCWTAIFSI